MPNAPPKPRDDEIDVYGLTHKGKVRAINQDQFLLGSIHRRVNVLLTSLSDQQRLPLADERLAFIAMIADGVGGATGGERASATALEIAMQYVTSSMKCYHRSDSGEEDFINALQDAAMECHHAVREQARIETGGKTMATTLTLWMGVWPYYYILQVGDSRYYHFRLGKLTQVSRDQTIAQDLVDQGVFTRAVAGRSSFSSVLSSAIGGKSTEPVVTRMQWTDWNDVHLICSDGLTKHVSDERITERLSAMTSAKGACEQLLQDALDGGGTDNVTIIVGRVVQKNPV
jgi:protein phosphatase